jgi:preprotein translocase subunit SecE
MSTKTGSADSSLDLIKLIVALGLLLASVVGYYYFDQESVLYRVLGMLFVIGVGVWIALTTKKGRSLLAFMTGARTEVRKMVWPTRVETMQTTLMVFIIVVLLSIFLWIVDMLLGWGVKALLATGGG